MNSMLQTYYSRIRPGRTLFLTGPTRLGLALFLLWSGLAPAQSIDPTFDPGSGVSGFVFSVAAQADGKVLIGGLFTSYNGTARSRIARLNADGSLDTGFNPGSGPNSSVFSVAVQADGKILISGFFTQYNGTDRSYIARLNADGSLDTSFNPGSGPDRSVESVVVQADGKVLIGGEFTYYNGTDRSYIARLNADGSLDTSFNPGSGVNAQVYSVVAQADGKVLIGGIFTSYNGTARSYIARLNADGSLDTGFNPGSGANSRVRRVVAQADGKVLIGGDFTQYNGTARSRIARLNADGSLDTGFDPGSGADNTVISVAAQADGKVLIGGNFIQYNGTAINRIARLNTDGSLDTGFDPGSGANSRVYSVVAQADGKVLIGGEFTSYNGTARSGIARLLPPALSITGFVASPAAVCVGSVASFTATVGNLTGSYSYTLTNGTSPTTGTATSATFSQGLVAGGTGPQTFTLTVSNGSQRTSATTTLTVNPRPAATLTAMPSAMLSCAQTSLTLTAGGGTSSVISGPGILSQSGNQAVVNAPGSYSVSVTNAGCTSTTTIAISQDNTAPSVSLMSSGSLTCAVTSVTLTANAGPGLTYQFSSGASQIGTSNQAVVSTAGLYSVRVTSANGCTAVASTSVSADQSPPSVSINPSSATLSCASPSVSLTAVGMGSVRWNTGSTDNPISVSSAGTYSVTLTGTNGCSATALATITLKPAPTAPTITTQPGQAYPGGQASVTVPQYSGTVSLLISGCEGTIAWQGPNSSRGSSTSIAVSTSATGSFVYSATCQQESCSSPPASATVTVVAAPLQLLIDRYDCASRQLVLRTTGGNGQPIEYHINSVTTGWDMVGNLFILDSKHIGRELKLRARQRSGSGGWDEVGITFTPTACSSARAGVSQELGLGTPLRVVVLGNPVTGQDVSVEVAGAEGQPLRLSLTNLQGQPVSERVVEGAGAVERQTLRVAGQPAGVLLLRVSTPSQTQTVKVLKR